MIEDDGRQEGQERKGKKKKKKFTPASSNLCRNKQLWNASSAFMVHCFGSVWVLNTYILVPFSI